MKKIISYLLVLSMLFAMVLPAYAVESETPTITMVADKSTMDPGETVTLEISIDKTYTNLTAYQLNLYFDPALFTVTATVAGAACNKTEFGTPQVDDGSYYYPGETYLPIFGFDTDGLAVALNAGVIATVTFTAKEEIAAESQFKLVADSITDYDNVTTNYAEGLAVIIKPITVGTIGPAMPEDAPFTAISTNAGPIVSIERITDYDEEDEENVDNDGNPIKGFPFYDTFVPYYHVTIPDGATTVYVTDPNQPVYDDYALNKECAACLYADIDHEWGGVTAAFDFETVDGAVKVIIPMEKTVPSMSGGEETNLCFLPHESHDDGVIYAAFAGENSSYAPTYLLTFDYAVETYDITIDPNLLGGTIVARDEEERVITKAKAGDTVWVELSPSEGYRGIAYTINGEIANDFVFQMPAEDVVLSATFEHSCVCDQSVVDDIYLKSAATCSSGAVYYKSCVIGHKSETETFIVGEPNPDAHNYVEGGACEWCGAADPNATPGYRFATSADVSAENGGTAVVHVKITGHSNPSITGYNAYDVTLTYDSEKLELATDNNGKYIYTGAVKDDGGSVTVNGDKIRIVGCGEPKAIGAEIAVLTFKTKAAGPATVTIDTVLVADSETAIKEAPEVAIPKHQDGDNNADETPAESLIVVPYAVEKPDFVEGATGVLHGETYTFSYTDTTNYAYSDLAVTVGGTPVTPTEANGVYTIAGVTGAIEITATQTPNSYDVFKPENVTGLDKATYGTPYIFSVTPSAEDMAIDTVKVTLADETEILYTLNENGQYVIEGTDITGAFTITVTEKEKMTTIKFTGIEETEIEGGKLTMTAEIGKDFTFKLIKLEEMDYIVKVGDKTLEEKDGAYTIPAELVVKSEVTVNIEKVDESIPTVDVQKYIDLDGTVMFLVTAKWRDNVLAWGEETMFYSERYTIGGEVGAYCWLVLSTDELSTVADVKLYALSTIKEAAEGATPTNIRYDYDVNGTTKVDVNDAQLVYDMYNAHYTNFTVDLPMLKFLEADVQTDMELNTQDVATIINVIVSGAMPA